MPHLFINKFPKSTLKSNKSFIVLGKALWVCQRFERDFGLILSLAKFNKAGHMVADEMIKIIRKDANKRLGDLKKAFIKGKYIGDPTKEFKKILKRGVMSRNYIAHSSCGRFVQKQKAEVFVNDIKEHVSNIAIAHIVIKLASADIHKKKPPISCSPESFSREVVDWVIGDYKN
ncbi:MAG: hypothetical protein KAT05_06680 [Spirochaetes bacterium]|nr:hypothetical protein [Spirochaetota bacterium]